MNDEQIDKIINKALRKNNKDYLSEFIDKVHNNIENNCLEWCYKQMLNNNQISKSDYENAIRIINGNRKF